MKIIYLFTAITWYRMELFKSISNFVDIKVFILNDAPKGYENIEYVAEKDLQALDVTLLSKEESDFRTLTSRIDKEEFDSIVVPSMNNVGYLFLTTRLASYYSHKGKKVLYFWEYWPMEKTQSTIYKKIKETVRHLFIRINKKYITKYIVPSINTYSFYQRIGIPAKKMIRCVNSSEIEKADISGNIMRSQLGISNNRKVVLFFGRLEEYKGINELLKVFTEIEDIGDLVVCGPGAENYSDYKRNNIHFTGSINPSDRSLYYSMADLFVLPNTNSGKIEPWGLTVNEAMSFGLPLLVTDATGSGRDLVFPGINGYIMDSSSLIQELKYYLPLLLNDEKKLIEFGENSRRIISIYSFNNMAKAFVAATEH